MRGRGVPDPPMQVVAGGFEYPLRELSYRIPDNTASSRVVGFLTPFSQLPSQLLANIAAHPSQNASNPPTLPLFLVYSIASSKEARSTLTPESHT